MELLNDLTMWLTGRSWGGVWPALLFLLGLAAAIGALGQFEFMQDDRKQPSGDH